MTGEVVWFNHAQVFHLAAAVLEYGRISGLRRDVRSRALAVFARLATTIRSRTTTKDKLGMHATHADGGEIALADLERVFDAIWKNMVIRRWELGDVVAIDNRLVSHGRLPYRGPRTVAVCWA